MAPPGSIEPEANPPRAWMPLPAAARWLYVISGGLWSLFICAALGVGLSIQWIASGPDRVWPLLAAVAALAVLGAWFGHRRWRAVAWNLDDLGLRVRRGVCWQTEVLVPRTRVQHLDLERGPIERNFGLASLIVHTAGTRTHALRLSGLAENEAAELRNALIPQRGPDDGNP